MRECLDKRVDTRMFVREILKGVSGSKPVAQWIECLPGVDQALDSIPSTTESSCGGAHQ